MRAFLLPDLGEGLEEAEIVSWHVTEGDLVRVGAALVEFAEGAEEDVGTVVGELQREEQKPAGPEAPAEPTRPQSLQVVPAVRALARKLDVDLNLVQATGPSGSITRAD